MEDRERSSSSGRKKSSKSKSKGGGRNSRDGSPSKKKKAKKKPTTAEDALEAKMRAKKKREKAEDALEAKIRKKNEAAAAAAESSRRPADLEEEKVEEGFYSASSASSADEFDEERGGGGGGRRGAAAVDRGVPVTSAPATGDRAARPDRDSLDASGNRLFTRGGGDVRDRPPPGQQQEVMDPLRAAELEKQKNKKQVNSKFADMHETGQWGALNKYEKYGICALTLGAVVTAIVVGVIFGRDTTPPTPSPTRAPSLAPSRSPSTSPTMAPTDVTYRQTFGLELMIEASPKLTLPQTPEELVGAKEDATSTPQELAAEFILHDDTMDIPARDPRFMERYALVVFYYQNGGCVGDWTSGDGWLTSLDHCEWYGVVCDLKKRVIELNQSGNYVTGKIPMELGQLLELSTLDLSNNAMVGQVPVEAVSMRKMYTIQLNNNMLTGEFPFEEVKKGAIILDNLWIQENTELGGAITEAYCAMNSVTLDCDNFGPQPTYPVEYDNVALESEGYTTYQIDCITDVGKIPGEYTCNFDPPQPFPRVSTPPQTMPVCGTPAAGT